MTRRRRPLEDILGPATAKRGRPVEAHRVRLATAQAELAEIRAAKMRGDLVPAADVAATWAGMIADARQRLLAVPSRFGAKHAMPRDMVADLDQEIRSALTALASQGSADDAGDL